MFKGASAVVQTAWFVRDIDDALKIWVSRGAGPFRLVRNLVLESDHRGQASVLDLSVAWGQFDGMQVELIQQHNDAASAFHDSYPDGPPAGIGGIHHLGMVNPDYDKAIAGCRALGFEPATSGNFDGTRFAHVDTREAYGFMTELTEATDAIITFYRELEDMARNWDGSDPVRPL